MKRIHLSLAAGALSLAACSTNDLGNISAEQLGDMTLGPAPMAPFDAELAAACGEGGLTAAGDSIGRAPYLQGVSDRSAALLWTSVDPEPATVAFWRPDAEEETELRARVDESARPAEGRQYVAELAELEPSSLYCYELRGAGGEVLAGPTGFRTAPPAGAEAPVRFAVAGDLGQATPDQFAVAGQMQRVEHDFSLLTGDIAYDSGELSSFEAFFFDVYEEYLDNVPVFPAAGNHDFRTGQAGPFREVFALPENGGERGREYWYSFDWGSVHVAVLDTEQVGAAQAAWLEEDLAATEQPWKVVIGHKPPYSSGSHGSNSVVRDAFEPIFQRYGVQLTLWGHDHNYERSNPIGGVTYVVTGGGGVGTRGVGASDFTAFSAAVAHFVYVVVEGDRLRLWAIDGTGQTFDTLELRGAKPAR